MLFLSKKISSRYDAQYVRLRMMRKYVQKRFNFFIKNRTKMRFMTFIIFKIGSLENSNSKIRGRPLNFTYFTR